MAIFFRTSRCRKPRQGEMPVARTMAATPTAPGACSVTGYPHAHPGIDEGVGNVDGDVGQDKERGTEEDQREDRRRRRRSRPRTALESLPG
ncbi:MAG: hypothetical protein U5Q44_14955 [Dehalococcoidia bacterium]|nr:hypothetical protein [Dehalococcoidia bacterium]